MAAPLDGLIDRFTDSFGEEWFSKSQMVEAREELYRLVKSARKEIKIVSGELNGKCYETSFFADALASALARGVEASIVFHRYPNMQEAIKSMYIENERIVSLKRKYDNLHLYWQRERNPKHFCVVDSNAIHAEVPHGPGEDREVMVKRSTSSLGIKAEQEFDSLVERECKEIDIPKKMGVSRESNRSLDDSSHTNRRRPAY